VWRGRPPAHECTLKCGSDIPVRPFSFVRVALGRALSQESKLESDSNGRAAFVIDFTERFRRVSEGIAILQLSSGDEISVQIPAEHKIVTALALSVQRFDAFDLLCEFVRRAREENHSDLLKFRIAALKVAGFDPETL
jgi:hypothetical protein